MASSLGARGENRGREGEHAREERIGQREASGQAYPLSQGTTAAACISSPGSTIVLGTASSFTAQEEDDREVR
jgi:hypothetical protein